MAYAGYYKNHYLRSSYEYAFALYLDANNVRWDYEVETYDLGFKKYKPDFFIYDHSGNLIKVVEVKSNKSSELQLGNKTLESLKNLYDIDGELVTYPKLLKVYQSSMNRSLNSVLTEWIRTHKQTSPKGDMRGTKNPHYGISHSENTKKTISESSKDRWRNDKVREKMLEGLRKGRITRWLGDGIKTTAPRTTYTCEICEEEFVGKVSEKRRFCSKTCAGKEAIVLASNGRQKEREERYAAIRNKVKDWSIKNRHVVLNAKYNEILPTLSPLISEIESEFKTKDIRIIGYAVFSEYKGRKELLRYMKELAKSS